MTKPEKIISLFLSLIFLSACTASGIGSSPTPTDLLQIRDVIIPFDDYPDIRGTLYGSGDPAIILVHMGNLANSQKDWADFARAAAQENFTVLTIDVPGFDRTPVNDKNPTFEETVLISITYLESLGYSKIICIGASAGGNACLSAANQYPLAGLGVISSDLPDTNIHYSSPSMAKFFACTENDSGGRFLRAQEEMYKSSPEPKELHIFQGDTHGTDIFRSFFQKELTDALLLFLRSFRTLP